MRIVAGEFKGRRLASPPRRSADVRPTSDRAREALFAILGEVGGVRVLDLFCGTGALGIEAVSRGAGSAVLVDSDTRLVARNVDALGLAGRCAVVRSDALRYLGRDREPFDLVLCDPPYAAVSRLGPELARMLPPRVAEGGRVVVESAAREPLDLDPGSGLALEAERVFGEASIRIWRR